MNNDSLLSTLPVQAAPLFAAGAPHVYVAVCCSRSYVGVEPPERKTCSACGAPVHAEQWAGGNTAELLGRLAAAAKPGA
jgi:hypothetical protein